MVRSTLVAMLCSAVCLTAGYRVGNAPAARTVIDLHSKGHGRDTHGVGVPGETRAVPGADVLVWTGEAGSDGAQIQEHAAPVVPRTDRRVWDPLTGLAGLIDVGRRLIVVAISSWISGLNGLLRDVSELLEGLAAQ